MTAQWVLILISAFSGYDQGTMTSSVSGFFSRGACERARDAWVKAMTDEQHAVGGKAFCVYTGDHPQ